MQTIKTQDYTATLVTVDNFLQQFPQSPNRDYAVYMAGLTNLATADNMIQDFFGIVVQRVKQRQ